MAKKDNTLIKKKNLVLRLKEKGVKRINKNSVLVLEKYFEDSLDKIIDILKEEIFVQGKKTLGKEDVERILKEKNKEEFWEI